ncbi:MAG TPA: hypothetical protein VI248_00720 [Kineosporiaceae bacterium]
MRLHAGQYEGQQYVGIDLHRRRSVVVRMTDAGELLEAVQIVNSPLALAQPAVESPRTNRWPVALMPPPAVMGRGGGM